MRWLLLLPVSFAFTLMALLLAPILPLFADRGGWLPRWLWWFQTPDNSLYGDAGHKARWLQARGTDTAGWLPMVLWLWRNPGYGFEWDGPLALTITRSDTANGSLGGDPWIRNRANARAGAYWCRIGPAWNVKIIRPLFGDTALMIELGWKLQEFAQGRMKEGRAMYVASVRLTAFYPKAGT